MVVRHPRLDEIAEVRLGRQRSPKNHVGNQMRAYMRAANVGWGGLILDDVKTMNFTDAEMTVYRLAPGDILLGEASGSAKEVGKPALWNGEMPECAFQNTLLRVRPHDADHRYLHQFFKFLAESGKFAAQSRGVGIFHLGREALASWRVPLPPIDEQRRIADVLGRADALRAKRREALSLLDDVALSLFYVAMSAVDPAARHRPLGELVEHVTVGHVGPTSEFFTGDGVPFLRTGNVGLGEVILKDLKMITPEFHLQLSKSRLQADDVILSRVISDSVRCAVVPPELDGANCANVVIIRPGLGVSSQLLSHLIRSPESQSLFLSRRVGSAQSVVNTGVIKSWPVALPPPDVQVRFDRGAGLLAEVRSNQRQSLGLLNTLFAALQQRAFSGQL